LAPSRPVDLVSGFSHSASTDVMAVLSLHPEITFPRKRRPTCPPAPRPGANLRQPVKNGSASVHPRSRSRRDYEYTAELGRVIEQTEREIGNAQDKARLAKDARSRVGRRHALGEKSNEQTEFGRAAKAGQGGVWRPSPYTGRPALPQIEASAVPLLLTLCLVGCILVAFAALAHYGASHVR
jgi:hypothetical protein